MRTTIDAAGRVVVPKALRDAMHLRPGQEIDIVFTDGRLEIEIASAAVRVEIVDGLPLATPDEHLPQLSGDSVRETVEETRR